MKIDRLIRKLLPQDDKFYSLFEESTMNLVNAADAMKDLARSKKKKDRDAIVRKIKDLEHLGDDLTHKMYSELNSTFVTPLDREDIHHLASSLDDIMDHIDGTAARFIIYRIDKVPPDVAKLADILRSSIGELHTGIGLLRKIHEHEELQKIFKRVNEYENVADRIFEDAIMRLFDKEKDPIQIIKLKELFVGLETATDKCEDVANVLEAIIIKNA